MMVSVVSADTVILRDRVGQLIGTVIHQSTSAVVIDVGLGVLIPVRRSDVLEVIASGANSIPFASPDAPPNFNMETTQPRVSEFDSMPSAPPMQIKPFAPQQSPTPMNTGDMTTIPFEDISSFPQIEKPAVTPTVTPLTNPIVDELLPFLKDNLSQTQTDTTQVSGELPDNLPLLPVVIPKGRAFQVSGGGVRFREGPSLDYPIVTSLAGRSVLLEIETIDGWLHAKTLQGEEGWIHTNFIQPMQNQKMIVDGDNLYVRESAGEIYRSLDRLRRGDVVIKLDERPGWHFVLTNGGIAGWSSAEFLQPLDNPDLLASAMRTVLNEAVNNPVMVERTPDGHGQQKITFTVRDDNMVVSGKTKLCILRNVVTVSNTAQPGESSESNLVSENILNRQQLNSPADMIAAGLPEALAMKYNTAEVLTVLGSRTTQGWDYSLTIPNNETVSFAFIVQKGPNRGVIVEIP